MILGMTPYTFLHVAIGFVGIGSGLAVVFGLLNSKIYNGGTLCFLVMTIATSVTGFGFPFRGFTPAIGTGILSMIAPPAAATAFYVFRLAGSWRWIYVVGAVVALYFNVFVLIVQLFQKVAALKALAPTQSEPPFLIAQVVTLIAFIAVAIVGVRKFHPLPGVRTFASG